MKKKIKRTTLYFIGFAVLLLAMNGVLGFVLTKQSTEAMKNLIRNRMLDISNTAAAMLDGDILESIQAEDYDTDEYKAILKTLTYYQDNIELKYIYCIRDMGYGNFVFTIDPTVNDPGEFGEPIVFTNALKRASLGTASVDDEPYEDRWGRFYSAYSPVYNSNNEVAGIVAVDFSAEWYDRQVSNLVRTIIIISIISLCVGTAIMLLIVHNSRNRFRNLYKELNRLSDGIEILATELAEGKKVEGIELLHDDKRNNQGLSDEVEAVSDKIRSLQEYMSVQIGRVRADAYRDGLTGLENRTAYLDHEDRLDEKVRSRHVDFCVAMYDINDLKIVNDTEGHERGDKYIIKAAVLLQESFPEQRIFRIGGDEFVVIIAHTGDYAKKMFDDCQKAVSDMVPQNNNRLLMSGGFAQFDPLRDRKYKDMFDRADRQMYEQKKAYHMSNGNRRRT